MLSVKNGKMVISQLRTKLHKIKMIYVKLNFDNLNFKLNEEGLKSKKIKIEPNGIKRTTCFLEDRNSPFLGFGELGHTVWRRVKFWVDFSPFLGATYSSKEKERKATLKVSRNRG